VAEDDAAEVGEVGEVADELYALDPADFVAGRTALVRRLRAEKRRDVAAEVAKLRRPTPAAWAVNQLARARRGEVEALLGMGRDLRTAQERVLGGADAGVLRAATKARRDAVAALTAAAAGLLAARGAGVDAHLPGVIATLEAASLDPELGAAVVAGRLSTESEPPSGFGGLDVELADLRPAPEARAEPKPAAEREPEPEEDEQARLAAARRDAERALARARDRAGELAEAARSAAKGAERRAEALVRARDEVTRLRARLEDAERDLATAEDEAGDAARRLADAEAAAAEAADRVHEAEQHRRGLDD
jgi:hypothetical protein